MSRVCTTLWPVWDLSGILFFSSILNICLGSREFIKNFKGSLKFLNFSFPMTSSVPFGSLELLLQSLGTKPWALVVQYTLYTAYSAVYSPWLCLCPGLSSWRTESKKGNVMGFTTTWDPSLWLQRQVLLLQNFMLPQLPVSSSSSPSIAPHGDWDVKTWRKWREKTGAPHTLLSGKDAFIFTPFVELEGFF